MKTLLQINVTANSGSHGKIAEEIGRLAIEKGWRSIIAYGRCANPSQNELIRIGSDLSVKEHGIESRLFDNHGLSSRLATKRFLKEIDKITPDIIHIHNIHGYYLNYKILFEYLSHRDIPVVWTFHDCWPFTGHCAHFDYEKCNLWKNGCHAPCVCKGRYPQSLWMDQSERNWKFKRDFFNSIENMTIVPVSYWLGGLVKQSFLGNFPMKVIHNGIDLELFYPMDNTIDLREKYCLGNKHILLGVANVWNDRKGLDDFIRLAEKVPEEYQIVLIGLKESQIKKMPCNILGLSRTSSQKELAMWYTLADIVMNLSYEETFGMTTVEGLACGTPGVVYDRTASPELADDVTCFVAEAGNIDDVLIKIKNIGHKTETLSSSCRNRAKEYYDNNKCYEEYIGLYEKLIKSGSSINY